MDVRGKVTGPAIGMLVVALGGFFFSLFFIVFGAMKMAGAIPPDPSPGAGPPAIGLSTDERFALVAIGGMAVMAVVTAIGAWKMKNVQSYGLSMAACIMSCIPCYNSCCLLGIPFGIWGIVVLLNPEVKDAFLNQGRGPQPGLEPEEGQDAGPPPQ
jgi:hypothetical protein